MSTAQASTTSTFEADVLKSDKPVVVDFWAEWCGPCKFLSPTVDELAGEYGGKVIVKKVNVDEEPMLSQRYGVMSIPTLLYFKDGKIVDSTIGALPKDELKKHFEKLVA